MLKEYSFIGEKFIQICENNKNRYTKAKWEFRYAPSKRTWHTVTDKHIK